MNKEGYKDTTADTAVARMARKERKMGKTNDDKKIHDKAVKIRKKTDQELVAYVEDRVAKSFAEGYNKAKREVQPAAAPSLDLEKLLDEIGMLPGIGLASVGKIRRMMVDKEYIHE